jgi:hypothetical protein
MFGILLTIAAVFLAICFAFYFAEHPLPRGIRADALFYCAEKPERNSGQL